MNLGVKHACPYNNNGARAHTTTLKEEGAWARVGRVDGGGGDRWRRIWISEWMDGWMDVGWIVGEIGNKLSWECHTRGYKLS